MIPIIFERFGDASPIDGHDDCTIVRIVACPIEAFLDEVICLIEAVEGLDGDCQSCIGDQPYPNKTCPEGLILVLSSAFSMIMHAYIHTRLLGRSVLLKRRHSTLNDNLKRFIQFLLVPLHIFNHPRFSTLLFTTAHRG